jgi:hypothetical protein
MADLPPLPSPRLGRYRHYKGGEYEVLGVARHSETLEPLVVYRPLYNQTGRWVRPYAMFFEQIEHDGRLQPRFALLGDNGIPRPTDASVDLVSTGPLAITIAQMDSTASDVGFSHQGTRLGEVHIFQGGKQVATLRGKAAARFLAKVQGAGHDAIQAMCARIIANYKRGHEGRTGHGGSED